LNYLKLLEENILKNKTLKININLSLYTKSTILKSTYKFTDRVYIYLEKEDDNQITIYFTPKNIINLNTLSSEFMNELLDQELRTVILSETSKVRDVIVTRALLSGQNTNV